MSKAVIIEHVVKKYQDFKAIDDVSLRIEPGEFFTLLGPSGCGKTTLLRMIAGFNSIEAGTIAFDSDVINNIPSYKRNIGMVFQNYAIFPHLSVKENVAYGLKARKIRGKELEARVNEAMELTQIDQYKDRQPAQLSGGQQQRVALARAIVIHPDLLLMDEPLSNLDAKLRVQMRTSIRELQKNLNITTIYVTHDQQEALAVSDRIAVMNHGVVEQTGKPFEIYKHPDNEFVAGFIGTTSFIEGSAAAGAVTALGKKQLGMRLKNSYTGPVKLAVRPEQFDICPQSESELSGSIKMATFLGDFINYEIQLDGGPLVQANEYIHEVSELYEAGRRISLRINESAISIYDGDGRGRLE